MSPTSSAAVVAVICATIVEALAQEPSSITLATVPAIPSASTFIALEKGYFQAAGLDVTIERIDSLTKAVPFLATNRIQVAQGGINASYFNSVAKGLPVILALESGSTPLYHRIVLRPELKDRIRTPADLKGLRVAVSGMGSTSGYEVGMVLAKAGLTIKDVDLKYVAFAQMLPALANGALDAALEVSPFLDIAIEQKIAVPWVDPEVGYITPLPMTNVAYVANTEWIEKNRDVARRLFLALARAGRDYCQAYHGGPNRAEVIDIMIKNNVLKDRALLAKMPWQARNPNGTFNVASLRSIQSFFKREGTVDVESPDARLADTSFAAEAARELGPFELINKNSKLEGCR